MMPLDEFRRADRNPKQHDVLGIIDSLRRFGFVEPAVINERTKKLVAGHGRGEALERMKADGEPAPLRVRVEGNRWFVPVLRGISFKNAAEAEAYLLASNRLPEAGGWDRNGVAAILSSFKEQAVSYDGIGYSAREIERIIALGTTTTEPVEPSQVVKPTESRVKVGEVWQLGNQTLICGDCRDATVWARAGVDGASADLVHADPPYGMDKSFENDGLKAAALDRFQIEWWRTVHPLLKPTASAFVWGNAPDLWRWWFGELQHWSATMNTPLTFGNEVVWDKESGNGKGTAAIRSFPCLSERALYFQLGRQGFGNKNKDRYWDGWDPIRLYLKGEFEAAGLDAKGVRKIVGSGMLGHWTGVSQWAFISADNYEKLHQATGGQYFCKAYGALQTQYKQLLEGPYNNWLEQERAFFDVSHDPTMGDVWRFPSVQQAERFGHDTPKPLAMSVRALRSAAPAKGLVLSPFGGTGTDLLAAEQTDRRCVSVELDPNWCEVIIQRWETLTNRRAQRA